MYSNGPVFHHAPWPARRKIIRPGYAARCRQRGVSLFIVLVVLLLSLIVVLGGLMVSTLNESIVGNQSDAQRAYGAAEALLDAAQRDIQLNGRNCDAPLGQSGSNAIIVAGQQTSCTLRYPRAGSDYNTLRNQIGINQCAAAGSNLQGVCITSTPDNVNFMINSAGNTAVADFAVSPEQTWDQGADYSSFSQISNSVDYGGSANVGSTATDTAANLALGTGEDARGRYWVEIFLYGGQTNRVAVTGVLPNIPQPDPYYPYVFRITAMARGLNSSTVSILRTYYVP